VLAPVLGELDRPAQRAGGQRHQHLLGPGVVDLHAEAAAHVGRDHVDLAEVQPQLHRDRGAHAGRALRGGPHLQPVDVGVPAGHRAPALHRHAGAALDGEVQLQPVRGAGDRGRRVADVLLEAGADVAGHVLVDEVLRGAGVVEPHDRREHLVVDLDPADRVLGDVAVVGDDEGDGLADVVHLVLGQGVLGAPVRQRRVRDQQRQRVGHRAGEVLVGPHRVHALDVEDLVDVDADDPRVGVRGAQDGRVQHGGVPVHADVVDVPAETAQEALVLDALDRGAHQLGGHASSAARSTAFTMFW